MSSFFWSLGSFVIALGILVAVHEWGHFYVARKCGVFVQRFSIGFGKPLLKWFDRQGTEYVIAAVPLGGYVRMLDERVDDVPQHKTQEAFNQKSVWQRMAIIFAGPGVNFVFAAFALCLMYWIGVQAVKPVVGEVREGSIAAQAALSEGQQIVSVNGRKVDDWEAVNFELVAAIGSDVLNMTLENGHEYRLDTSTWNFSPESESALSSLGILPFRPKVYPKISTIAEDSPALRGELKVGDVLLELDKKKLVTWQAWVQELSDKPGATVNLLIERDNQLLSKTVTLDSIQRNDSLRGYLGVTPTADPWPQEMLFTHEYGPIDGFVKALDKTWRLIVLSFEMIGKLLSGDVSVKNLSGPISIAQGAGASAEFGFVYFLSFLALISVNLGIINLLPLPMLDGGHLMFFIVEAVRGKPVSEDIQELGYRIGAVLLFTLMGIAIFNDITRLTLS